MIHVMKAIYSMVDGNVSEAIRGSPLEKVNAGSVTVRQYTFYIVVCCRLRNMRRSCSG